MILKATGLTLAVGAKTKEESWQLLMTNMRTVSSAGNHGLKEFIRAVAPVLSIWILSSPLDFVSSYLKDLELPTWIGLSDLLVENQYAWSDGVSAVLYTNWNDKEPNNAGGAVRIL